MRKKLGRVQSFDLQPGRKIGLHYEVVQRLGSGTEGEVYQILETETGIHRAAKLYFPHRDPTHRSVVWNARKLTKLQHCPIVLHYHHTQQVRVAGNNILCLISDLCEGMQLEKWVASHKGGRVPPYMAMHLLYHLARGLELIHAVGEYHADVHSQNILVQPRGIVFDLKLVDFYNWGRPALYKQEQDIIDAVRVFHECVGGHEYYSRAEPAVRHICAGLKKDLVLKRFPTISALRLHLESFEWPTG